MTDALPSQTLDDLRLQALPLVGVSASRGTDPEDITVLSDGSGGTYTIQVTSYNGAADSDPYMLRVTTEAPRAPATTASRSVTGATGSAVASLPAGFNTLFLVNRQRLEGLYGATAAASVVSAVTSNQASYSALGFPNAVLSVDAYPAVQTAYANWDANPGDPDLANKVVAAINASVDSHVRTKPNGAGLKYLVIVGNDQVIPQARLGDFTTVANESGYAETFDRSSDLYATLHAGQVLSDDPYGTLAPVPYLNRQLYVPNLSVGRLVETPAEIVATLNRFTAFSGRLDPASSLVTGYDFMQDGATVINQPFASRFGGGAATLPSPIATAIADWTRSTLLNAFLPAGGAPSIVSLNGHADHHQFAPPSVAPPYFATGDLPLGPATSPAGGSGPLTNRLVFSMGCHSGLSVSDAVVTGDSYDWPQAYSHNGVGAYLGNTGFGYGDSLVVAYSELLDSIFAGKIAAGSTVGNALAAAKQEYFGGLGVFGVYDEKAMSEFTLYGMPMWSVTLPGGAPAPLEAGSSSSSSGGYQTLAVGATAVTPTSTSVVTDSATGLQAETFTLDAIANAEHPSALGRYWSGPDGVQVTHFRPLQPKAYVEVTGTSGHGALITELRQQVDTPNVDPAFARPIIDTASTETELAFGDVAFPARLQALRTFRQNGALKQRVVFMTGQFFTEANPGTIGRGIQRLYTKIGARVLRSTSNDFVPPAFTRIDATGVGTTAAFSVDVTDLTHTGATGSIKRVVIAVRSGAATTWAFSDLAQVGTGARWSGGVPLPSAGVNFEYFVQAVDAAGNVGVSTNKGFYFAAAEPQAPSAGVTVAPVPTVPVGGWFSLRDAGPGRRPGRCRPRSQRGRGNVHACQRGRRADGERRRTPRRRGTGLQRWDRDNARSDRRLRSSDCDRRARRKRLVPDRKHQRVGLHVLRQGLWRKHLHRDGRLGQSVHHGDCRPEDLHRHCRRQRWAHLREAGRVQRRVAVHRLLLAGGQSADSERRQCGKRGADQVLAQWQPRSLDSGSELSDRDRHRMYATVSRRSGAADERRFERRPSVRRRVGQVHLRVEDGQGLEGLSPGRREARGWLEPCLPGEVQVGTSGSPTTSREPGLECPAGAARPPPTISSPRARLHTVRDTGRMGAGADPLSYARELERKDEDVAARLDHALNVLRRVDDVRAETVRIKDALAALPLEIEHAEQAEREALERDVEARLEFADAARRLDEASRSRRGGGDAKPLRYVSTLAPRSLPPTRRRLSRG